MGGCGCGGKKSTTPPVAKPTPAPPPRPAPQPPRLNASGASQYVLTVAGRLPQVFGSRLEAEAELKRAGGRGRISPP